MFLNETVTFSSLVVIMIGLTKFIRILDQAYSAKLLAAAKSLYAFAKAHPGIYSNSVPEAKNFYGYVYILLMHSVRRF